jgi:hypothetical protein
MATFLLTTEPLKTTLLMKNYLLLAMASFLFTRTFAQEDTTTAAISLASLPLFQVQPVDKVVLLKWAVEYSEDFKCFEIERADKGDNFIKVGSKLAITKSSNSDYDFVDATPKRNVPLRYRLKLISKDGFVTYSSFKEVKVVDVQMVARLKQNPVRSTIDVELNSATTKQASVTIVSQSGQQVASQTFRLTTGVNQLSISAQLLLQGFYQLVVEAGNDRKVISFIKE